MARGTRLDIRRDALRHNARRARALAGAADVFAMVKANGYGHGLATTVEALAAEVDGFGVAVVEEAVALRELAPAAPVMVLEGCFDVDDWQAAMRAGAEVVVHSAAQVATLERAALAARPDVWLKVDTGMHRVGVAPDECAALLARLAPLCHVRGLMTHFATADQQDDPFTRSRLAVLQSLAERFRLPWSAANSAALCRYPEARGQRVRPGIMLYGASPLEGRRARELDLAVTQVFSAPLIAINEVPAGEAVGYGGAWTAPRPSRIGVVAVGYGDGYPRRAANGAPVAVGGRRTVTVGRVSMDMITVDLTDLPEVAVGERVELWGDTVSVDEVARFCGTISYELFCQVTARPERRVI